MAHIISDDTQLKDHPLTVTYPGYYGTNSAAQAVTNLVHTFQNIRFGLMVGDGGAVPSAPHPQDPIKNVRLGDIVVSDPKGNHGGVLNYDMGKWNSEGELSIESHLNKPPTILLNAMKQVRGDHRFGTGNMSQYIDDTLSLLKSLSDVEDPFFPGENASCGMCDPEQKIDRLPRRSDGPVVHYGLIASGNAVMRNASLQDRLRDEWNVLCFEMEAAGLMNHFPCLVIHKLCDYSDSHKTKKWQPYAAVVAAAYAKDLLRVIGPEQIKNTEVATSFMENVATTLNHVDEGIKKLRDTMESTYRQKVLEWLSPFDYENRQGDAFSQHQKGTGTWFIESETFQKWVQDPKQTLLCQGIPRAGKTIMASIVVHHLHEVFRDKREVDISDQTIESIFTNLLKQLAQQQSQLPECVTEAYERFRLLMMLGTVIAIYRKIHASNGTCRRPISFFATSKPIADIASMFRRNHGVFLEMRAADDDVRSYVESQLDMLRPFVSEDPNMRLNVRETIVEAVDDMFLLSKFHLESSNLAMRTLGWIICSERPLTTSELQHALAVQQGAKALDEDAIPEVDMLLESGVFRLVHFTTQQYFQRKWNVWFPNAHSDIATVCLTYLSLDTFRDNTSDSEEGLLEREVKRPLFEYAAKSWIHHARLHTLENPLPLQLLTDPSCLSSADSYITPQCLCDDVCFSPPNNLSGLHLAAYLGFTNSAKQLIQVGIQCDVLNGSDRTPLAWAAEQPNTDVARLLLDNGANPNHTDDHQATPLLWAAGLGNQALVKLLLERGARPDIKDNASTLPLDRASAGMSETSLWIGQGIMAV
ncbi:hypothetical protein BDV27DRAFT_148101 [Aspergillus caelatus]|uniref:Nephrocystin 3-like N-terminal domain-containing protein n=1 Tax=Aspergillus caelatus TaxID=61420 RepID=A0A5N6ZUR8_9EURO|nr:uncharacterized protein BDV27DRAFT_148101 [Aspergillus caelatus]KAE8361128.1 hypothetical protein BDV27DRAFT_148101 [Aspergillus caelatus]